MSLFVCGLRENTLLGASNEMSFLVCCGRSKIMIHHEIYEGSRNGHGFRISCVSRHNETDMDARHRNFNDPDVKQFCASLKKLLWINKTKPSSEIALLGTHKNRVQVPFEHECCPTWVDTSNDNFWTCFLNSWCFRTSAYLQHTLFEQFYLNEPSQAKKMCTNVPEANKKIP